MSGAPSRDVHVVRAAAGCGKTTELACRYVALLARGIPAEQAVAITFTRRAAAELSERVTLVLDGLLGDVSARARLGAAWARYSEAAADAPREVLEQARRSLVAAPIGTTDSFVQTLLEENALDAALPVPGGGAVPIDVPIASGGERDSFLAAAAEEVLDADPVPEEVERLAPYFSLSQMATAAKVVSAWDELPLLGCARLLDHVAGLLRDNLLAADPVVLCKIEDPADVDAWVDRFVKCTRKEGVWAAPIVARWWFEGQKSPAPRALPAWIRCLDQRSAARKELHAALRRVPLPLEVVDLSLSAVVEALKYPYEDPNHVALADALRSDLDEIRKRVGARGLRSAASAGQLGYDDLLVAAIALCEKPTERLKGRYRALLVDEVQDASPGQVRLYRALSELPGMETWFVGDSRQSIYAFREAEPRCFDDLVRLAGDASLRLEVNHRSSPSLVAAQVALFSALNPRLVACGTRPLDAPEGFESNPDNARLELDPDRHEDVSPVWIVDGDAKGEELHRQLLGVFWRRLQSARAETGHDSDTAAVLTPRWELAEFAASYLNGLAGGAVATVEGRSAIEGRVATDVRVAIRALSDPTDDVAWLGLWKHPAIGLSDGALARVKNGLGLRFGRLHEVPALDDPGFSEEDRFAFGRAVAPIREALAGIRSRPTADVLDRLASRLFWRAVYRAGPGGEEDAMALDTLVDHLRETGAGPDAALAALSDKRTDLPRRRSERAGPRIEVTTTHQSKGLAWDHVAIVGMGHEFQDRDEPRTTWARVGDARYRLVGLKFDPIHGFCAYRDPIARLAKRIHAAREREEIARKAYVAITRARRSVTFALPAEKLNEIQEAMRDGWLVEPALPGVRVLKDLDRAPEPTVACGWAAPAVEAGPPEVPVTTGWSERLPSDPLHTADAALRAEHVRAQVLLSGGFLPGRDEVRPPDRPLAAHQWGDLAHGWFAWWRFRGEPARPGALEYLEEAWGDADEVTADWLVALSRALAERGGWLWDLVTRADAALQFEWPVLGAEGSTLWGGRADLLVETGRRVTVVDFKAGGRFPTGTGDLVEGASLKTYGPQLEAYRAALKAARLEVDRVALWFVRTGAVVAW